MLRRMLLAILLLLLPQRYKFSSKSQPIMLSLLSVNGCCCYCKGTNFQANHNTGGSSNRGMTVVVATAKVQIFKQITTVLIHEIACHVLLLLPQRYKFSSKSQPPIQSIAPSPVVVATAKVQIFKQITTVTKR